MESMSGTDLPKYNEFHWPALLALRSLGGSGSISEIEAAVAEQMGFTEEQQSILHQGGPMTEIGYRLHWARTYLKGMGLATNTERGVWALTLKGREVTEQEIKPLRNEYLTRMRKKREAAHVASNEDGDPDDGELSWQDRLLEALLEMEPDAFERLCRRVLREAGFSRTQVLGKSGDGGLDGVGVYRLSLVSFPVFFQAKRWRNSVGSKEIRDFRGAMAGRGEKGLLITTATFTAEAKAEASRDGAPPVDLVDGATLCDLLADYGIGVNVTERVVREVEINHQELGAI
ncbi:MAG: restriction endonuclease [Candidatus Nanopelagicales bacterium]